LLGLTSGAGARPGNPQEQELNNPHFATIAYGLFCFGTNVYVYENGKEKGGYGNYDHNDELSIVINSSGQVEYRINNRVLFVSEVKPQYPLHVKLAAYTPGEVLQDITWVEQR